MYVLPYGQMSLWGATVITNMLSAIPWIGQDFVQFKHILFLVLFIFFSLSNNTEKEYIPTIGVVNTKALRNKKACTLEDKQVYKNITPRFMAKFIGLVDGDGYIKVT